VIAKSDADAGFEGPEGPVSGINRAQFLHLRACLCELVRRIRTWV